MSRQPSPAPTAAATGAHHHHNLPPAGPHHSVASQHYHHRVTAREKAIERHNPGHLAGYPFMGDYKVKKGLEHGHSPRPPAHLQHNSYLCMRVSGNNVVLDEVGINQNEQLECTIGEVDPRQPLGPQTKSLAPFQFTGQRLSFPDNSKCYCLSSSVKNKKTHAMHTMQLVVTSSKDGTPSRPGTPRNTPRQYHPAIDDVKGGGGNNKMIRVRSDINTPIPLNITSSSSSSEPNQQQQQPFLLPAGSTVSLVAPKSDSGELVISPAGAVDINSVLAQKYLTFTQEAGSPLPVTLRYGSSSSSSSSSSVLVQSGLETKVPLLDAMEGGNIVLSTQQKIPEVDYGFELSGDGAHTVFTATIANYAEQQQQQQQEQQQVSAADNSWKIVAAIPTTGERAESQPENPSQCILQFSAYQRSEVVIAVWNSSSALLQQRIRVPALAPKPQTTTAGNQQEQQQQQQENNNSQGQAPAPQVTISVKDHESTRKVEVVAPLEISASVSPDALSWFPGLPGINIQDAMQNPVAHVSLLDRGASKKLAQLRLELPSPTCRLSEWIQQLSREFTTGALSSNPTSSSSSSAATVAATAAAGGIEGPTTTTTPTSTRLDENAISKVFESLTPPTNAEEKSFLLSLQQLLSRMLQQQQQQGQSGNTNNASSGMPRFSFCVNGDTIENVRCENASSLSLHQYPHSQHPVMIAAGRDFALPRSSQGETTSLFACDIQGRTVAAVDILPSTVSAKKNNTGGRGGPPTLTFNLGNDPNTITGFFSSEPSSQIQVSVGDSSSMQQNNNNNNNNESVTNVNAQSVVSLAGGQRATIRMLCPSSSSSSALLSGGAGQQQQQQQQMMEVFAQTIVEGNRLLGSKNLQEIWAQLDESLMRCPDASGLRMLKSGSDPWIDELVRVVRHLADPKRTFEIRYRGNTPNEVASVECGMSGRVPCSEAQPAHVCIADRVALVLAPSSSSSSSAGFGQNILSEPMLQAIMSTCGEGSSQQQMSSDRIEGIRSTIAGVTPSTKTDDQVQQSLLRLLKLLSEQQRRMITKAVPIRFSLPRGSALRNLRLDSSSFAHLNNDVTLYATMNGKRDRVQQGESMPPPSLSNTTDVLEIEAVQQTSSSSSSSSSVVSHVICTFGAGDGGTRGGAGSAGCIGFDCELLPSDTRTGTSTSLMNESDSAVMNLSAPQGFNITPSVDGLKGNSLGARGEIRLDPCASHVVQVLLEDTTGQAVLKQRLFVPRCALPRVDVFLNNLSANESYSAAPASSGVNSSTASSAFSTSSGGGGSSLGLQCPRGVRCLASVNGGAEKTTDQALALDCDTPHLVSLRFLGESLSRDGGRELCQIGEVGMKLPASLCVGDVQEFSRIIKDGGDLRPQRLHQLAVNTKSRALRDLVYAISPFVSSSGNNNEQQQQRPPLIPQPQPQPQQQGSQPNSSRANSRPTTPAIQFRLQNDALDDEFDEED